MKYTQSKNHFTKKIQEAIVQQKFKLAESELCGTVTADINELTAMLTDDTLLMKANNKIPLEERQELTAKALYRNLLDYFVTLPEYKTKCGGHVKLVALAKAII